MPVHNLHVELDSEIESTADVTGRMIYKYKIVECCVEY
jgi:hypothetical protein